MVNLKTENDFSKLKEFIVNNAKTSIHKPSGMLKYNYVTPTCNVEAGSDDQSNVSLRSTLGHYLQMYDWDACFFSQAMTSIDINYLIEDVIANFLNLKHADGYIPRTVSPNRIWDTGDMCKPFLAQTLLFGYEKLKNQNYFKYINDLDCYLTFYERTRLDKSGLYTWRNVLESGVDNNLALIWPIEASKDENKDIGIFPDSQLLAVDLNCYLYEEFRSMIKLAKVSNNNELASKYTHKAQSLMAKINNILYDAKEKFYFNVERKSQEFVRIKSWTNLLPVVYNIADNMLSNSIIENFILNTNHFNQNSGLSSMSKAEVLYNQAKRGLYGRAIVSNWQGPMWILPNAIILRYLKNTNYKNEALVIAKKVLNTVWYAIKTNGTMYENYNAHTGEALWAPQFMSWNSLCLELIDFVENN